MLPFGISNREFWAFVIGLAIGMVIQFIAWSRTVDNMDRGVKATSPKTDGE